jgi:hypothetical protein
MQTNKYVEAQNNIKQIVNVQFKILSFKNNELYLIEVEDGQRYVVNLTNKTIHATKSLDSGIDFEGTNFVLEKEIKNIELKPDFYIKDALMNRIMEILNLTSRSGWSIVDSVGKLHLIHYTDDANMAEVGHLRGVLVDVEHGRVICSSYGYTPTVKSNHLEFLNGEMVLQDDLGQEHLFEESTTVIKRIHEGVIMRVIYYEGETFRLTHKKIRPLKSRYGNYPFFTKMYKAAGGPTDDQLFDLSKQSSPWCYVFLVVHPQLLMATRQYVKSPYVVLLSVTKLWESDDENVEQDQKYNVLENDINTVVEEPFVHKPKPLTIESANNHLVNGYYPPCDQINDIRQTAGEAVIMYKLNGEGKVIDIVKVNSSAYDYRFRLRGNDPNPYHRFFDLVPHSYHIIKDYVDYSEYREKFILFDNYIEADLLGIYGHLGFILYLSESEIPFDQRSNRQYILKNIWLNYVLSLPFSFQKEAITYLDRFIKDRFGVINWLQVYHSENQFIDGSIITERGKNIILSARNTAKDICKQQPQKRYHDTVKEVIRNFVLKEYGTSLYSLVKQWKA